MDLIGECIDHGRKGDKDGYVRDRHPDGSGRLVRKHRKVYSEHNGVTLESMEGFVVRHKCDNPRCINPDHLEIGTYLDNERDKIERGRILKGHRHGQAKLTPEQVREIRDTVIKRHPERSIAATAKRLGVSRFAVSRIVDGVGWEGY